jgi:putative long chain acyl-CoA synthase
MTPAPGRRRRRQVRWARRLRRLGLAWQNALEIARAGRLTSPYGAPFEVVHEDAVARLRRYQRDPAAAARPLRAPLLLVPPLMVASEVYDISPDTSAVAFLLGAGVDVWLVDFGAPEHSPGGMQRTLDDHVRAVADAIERVRQATGHDVHLAGYSQGGMFCYQAAAFRRSAGLASVIGIGSPVDLHRTVRLDEGITERVVAGLRAAIAWPLARIEGLPGVLTSTGFKVLSARKEVGQLVDFVRNLHDREALEKREAKRLFLGGGGFVAWPGPAFRQFVDELIVGNRMKSGGFVIDGHTVTLADLECPILYFFGSRDQMGRPAAVRGIRRAAPKAAVMYEITVKAGHFGLVVGSTALGVTWPSVVEWIRWREGGGPPPGLAVDVRASDVAAAAAAAAPAPDEAADDEAAEAEAEAEAEAAEAEAEAEAEAAAGDSFELAKELVQKTAHAALEQLGQWADDLGDYLDNARWQVPRITRLRNLQDDSLISLGRALAEQARRMPDRTFFLFRGRAFSYADANRRVDAVVRGLIASGIRPGQKVGVMMRSRPSHLTITAALNRFGAVSVLLSPETPDAVLPGALRLGGAEALIVDPDSAARARDAAGALPGALPVLVLGGVGEVPWAPGQPRVLPPGVIDMEAIDPTSVELPAWYRPDPGRARDLAMIFVSSGQHAPPRAVRISNRRWAYSALGAAAAATLTTRDTVYCCLPLHHPSGTLVATGSALVGGARLALASAPRGGSPLPTGGAGGVPSPFWFEPQTFWDEVRRYGVTVVYYAGEMCRRLVDAPPVVGEKNNPVRLFAGSGLRRDVWRRLVERFGPVGVLELYASTEASTVLANARGKKIGSVGRPLPGSPEVAIAAWSFVADDFVRDGAGRLQLAPSGEPGMLVARLSAPAAAAGADHIDPKRLLGGAFAPGDLWFVTGDFFEVDADGDHWLVDRHSRMIRTPHGAVASMRIEDALYEVPGVALCAVSAAPDAAADPARAVSAAPAPTADPARAVSAVPAPAADPAHPVSAVPVAAIQLHPGATLDVTAVSAAMAALPEYARPQRLHVVAEIPLTDGFRVIERPLPHAAAAGSGVYAWDARAQRYVPAGDANAPDVPGAPAPRPPAPAAAASSASSEAPSRR